MAWEIAWYNPWIGLYNYQKITMLLLVMYYYFIFYAIAISYLPCYPQNEKNNYIQKLHLLFQGKFIAYNLYGHLFCNCFPLCFWKHLMNTRSFEADLAIASGKSLFMTELKKQFLKSKWLSWQLVLRLAPSSCFSVATANDFSIIVKMKQWQD